MKKASVEQLPHFASIGELKKKVKKLISSVKTLKKPFRGERRVLDTLGLRNFHWRDRGDVSCQRLLATGSDSCESIKDEADTCTGAQPRIPFSGAVKTLVGSASAV